LEGAAILIEFMKYLKPARPLLAAIPAIFSVQAAEPVGVTGELSRSVWYTSQDDHYLEGLFADHHFYEAPDVSSTETVLSSGVNTNPAGVGYGQRYRGYLVAPVTGEYRFWVTGDDDQGLWLGTSDSKFSKVPIARSRDWTIPGNFGQHREQESVPVSLVAGQRYYLEAL